MLWSNIWHTDSNLFSGSELSGIPPGKPTKKFTTPVRQMLTSTDTCEEAVKPIPRLICLRLILLYDFFGTASCSGLPGCWRGPAGCSKRGQALSARLFQDPCRLAGTSGCDKQVFVALANAPASMVPHLDFPASVSTRATPGTKTSTKQKYSLVRQASLVVQ